MNPQDTMDIIEAANGMVDLIDNVKEGLISRGWDTPAAEHAATIILNIIMNGPARSRG